MNNGPSSPIQRAPDEDPVLVFSDVLLIEDERAHAELIIRALRGVVGNITHVETGARAIEEIQTTLPDLVISDLHLPDTSGIDILREIQAARPLLPVIVLTSSGKLDDAVRAMREGAWDYVVKEFSSKLRSQLELVIERTLQRKMAQLRELKVRSERDAFWVAAFSAQDGLAIVSEEGRILFSNEAFKAFLRHCKATEPKSTGANGEEQEGSSLLEILHALKPELAERLQQELKTDTQAGIWNSELEIETGEGEDKASYTFEMTLTTVSPQKLEDLPRFNGVLPRLRYHVLWNRDISRKKEQERFHRDLLSTTTHDLKGPLGAILTSAEMLEERVGSVDDKASDFLTRIASCARNSISIIDELLSARRIEDGVLEVYPKSLSVLEILTDLQFDYIPIAKAKGLRLDILVEEPELNVFADGIGIQRILGNLLTNALKFTPKGGQVVLEAVRTESGVVIRVKDTGQGIEPSLLHTLFERFGRLSRHREIDGTGLGLYVVKNIVEAHGGKIEVKSSLGQGSSFDVYFPNEPVKPQPLAEE